MTKSAFARHAATARLYPATTQKAAIASARASGVMIRREAADAGEFRGFEVYPVGSPDSALYAECIREAAFLAEALAHDVTANRLSLFGARPTLRGMAEALASRAAKAAGLDAGDVAATVEATDSGPVVVFSGPWGCEYRAPINARQTIATLALRVAPAAEAAADEIAAHAAEARGSWLVSDMVATVAAQRKAEAEEARRHAGPRSLSAAANPDAPAPRRMARTRAELARELAEAEEAGDSLAAELAELSLVAAAGQPARASGGFPLYAFRDGRAYDADSLDALAYGPATGGLF